MFMKRAIVFAALVSICSFPSFNNANAEKLDSKTHSNSTEISITSNKTAQEKASYNSDQLYDAVLSNDQALVKKILSSKEVDVNQKNSSGQYPLEGVLMFGNCEMAKILLSSGADPYVVTSDGISIYDTVMNGDNKAMKKIFLKYKK